MSMVFYSRKNSELEEKNVRMFLLLSTFKFSSHLKIDLAPALVCPGRQLHVTRHRRELAQDVVMYLWNTGTINTHIIGGRPEVYLDVPLKHCSHHWYTICQCAILCHRICHMFHCTIVNNILYCKLYYVCT